MNILKEFNEYKNTQREKFIMQAGDNKPIIAILEDIWNANCNGKYSITSVVADINEFKGSIPLLNRIGIRVFKRNELLDDREDAFTLIWIDNLYMSNAEELR